MKKNERFIVQRDRRNFIKNTALVSFSFLALTRCSVKDILINDSKLGVDLIPDPENYLNLPYGFDYKIISRSGEMMEDGFLVPGRPDGMGTFEGASSNEVILVRNHENNPRPLSNSPFGPSNELLDKIAPIKIYDTGNMESPGLGGTTTMIYNETAQVLERQFLSLAGTYRNCAGGITPWGSWLSCEEDVTTKGGLAEKDHGFIFEVPAGSRETVNPAPIEEMGRFNHEAVAVHPDTSIVYMTEDRSDGLIYRYIPNVKERLHLGGQLQVLSILDRKGFDTRNWEVETVIENTQYEVKWLDIDDVRSAKDDLRYQGFENGAARFARGEGIWFGDCELYFACTNGGSGKWGQIFKYRPSPDEGQETVSSTSGTLELFVESRDRNVLNMCDNLTVAPWGDLMVCEDNGGRNRILGIRPDGSIYTFALNRGSHSEFAGIVFSPSGKTMFVNIQENGHTLAITGPWETLT